MNAIDAMPSGNGQLILLTKSKDSEYGLLIKDNGCGISKIDLEYIFKPYFATKYRGLGLGLATAYALLRSNNVRVSVESEIGRGRVSLYHFLKIYLFNLAISCRHSVILKEDWWVIPLSMKIQRSEYACPKA